MIESLSLAQARKLALLSQRLPPAKESGRALNATLSAIKRLGYIQIDTISVVERAHHHTLWNRNPRYEPSQLDQLLEEREVYEYWSHAAAYLPLCDFRFSLPRKNALASGEQKHWFDRDKIAESLILERITTEGPLMAKDFEHTGKRVGHWQAKPAKRALETLFMQGDLMVKSRVNFHKVYDLTERVLPAHTDTTLPSAAEHARFLITSYLQAHGLAQAAEIYYLRTTLKPLITSGLVDMLSSGELRQVRVGELIYYTLPSFTDLLGKPGSSRQLKILSPFDNLLIQRKRAKNLFSFDYLIECYLPKGKRQYGYFSLPILWKGALVARIDCKVDRKNSLLHIHHLALEASVKDLTAFSRALRKELEAFLRFNSCSQIQLHRTSPSKAKRELLDALEGLLD